jgi:hypothetical protein
LGEARSRLSPRRALLPILGLLDRSSRAAHERPDPAQDGTRFPEFSWDLRTLILVFPPEAPFRFLNLNLLLGHHAQGLVTRHGRFQGFDRLGPAHR